MKYLILSFLLISTSTTMVSLVSPSYATFISPVLFKNFMDSIVAEKPDVSSKALVKNFLEEVRSGKAPDRAALYLAENVLAHQVNAEQETTVSRTPQNYADHVREFLKMYGNYTFEITELLADGDKVYARWKQTGKHLTNLDGYAPTNQPLVEIASAVYRVQNGKIAEYWIQIDRLGLEAQLKQSASK